MAEDDIPPRIIIFIGDSDIAYWPSTLLPVAIRGDVIPLVRGHPGATLKDMLPHLRSVMVQAQETRTSNNHQYASLVIVACAGENDIGNGIALDDSLDALNLFLDIVFSIQHLPSSSKPPFPYLIFLGPKFEPWLEDDPSMKKEYSKMTRSFQRCFDKHVHASHMEFVDCLTMFCGETASLPGAVLGGMAKADEIYFAADKLHLSAQGYQVWKEVVEERIQRLLIPPYSNPNTTLSCS